MIYMQSVGAFAREKGIDFKLKQEWRDSPTVNRYTDFSKLDLSEIKLQKDVEFTGPACEKTSYKEVFADQHDPMLELNRLANNLNLSLDIAGKEQLVFGKNESIIGNLQINMKGDSNLKIDMGKYELACLTVIVSCESGSKSELSFFSQNSGITYIRVKKNVENGANIVLINRHIKDKFVFLDCDCNLNENSGLDSKIYIYSDEAAHYDCIQNVNHAGIGSKSKVIGRGVIDGSSSLIFRGMLKIHHEKCSGDFGTKTLNISAGDAFTDSVPMLDISANNVSAKHSSAIENIDNDKLFYLESRGFSNEDGRKLIIDSFLNPEY